VLWADCVELLEIDDVCLVTNDAAFYADRNFDSGLAPKLAAELAGKPHRLTIMSRLSDLLKLVFGPVDSPPWKRQCALPSSTLTRHAPPALVFAWHLGRSLRRELR
jgi:hypothetical protein